MTEKTFISSLRDFFFSPFRGREKAEGEGTGEGESEVERFWQEVCREEVENRRRIREGLE